MNAKKTTLVTAIGLALGGANLSANAALLNSTTLNFNAGVIACVTIGTPPDNCYGGFTKVVSGSWFGMDGNGDGTITLGEKTPLVQHDGIHIGSSTTALGSHTGAPFGAANGYTGTDFVQTGVDNNGTPNDPTDDIPLFQSDGNGGNFVLTTTETPGIDEPWNFFNNTGMHYSNAPFAQIADTHTSHHHIDFSGWTVTWNGIATIPLGTSAWNGNANGVATISCSSSSCSDTSSFTLDYSALSATGPPSGYVGVRYALHMTGTIAEAAVVPIPATAWLFGSGLLGLVGVARKRKQK